MLGPLRKEKYSAKSMARFATVESKFKKRIHEKIKQWKICKQWVYEIGSKKHKSKRNEQH